MAEVSKVNVAGFVFPPEVQPPGSSSSLFLAGAGERGLEIGGKFIVFTAIGVYLESAAIESLAGKWKGKSGDELAASPDFFRDIFTGSFDKLTNVTMVLPLSGQQYSEKVTENCIKYLKATGAYSEAEAEATEKFKESLKDESFPPGGSLLFTHSSSGSLTISFLKESSAPLREVAVIENGALSEAILESIIGEQGVSPTAKKSLAHRISGHLNEPQVLKEEEKLVMEPACLTVQQ